MLHITNFSLHFLIVLFVHFKQNRGKSDAIHRMINPALPKKKQKHKSCDINKKGRKITILIKIG